MSEHEQLLVTRRGPALYVTFNRPQQRNAMSWPMYTGLMQACDTADSDPDIRVMVLRGAGEEAFVAGTDIGHFAEFRTGDDGVAYEKKISEVLHRLESTRVPTVAAISGYCVGAGIALASVCDLRVSTVTGRFGVPVARTLGNCLAMNTYSLLVHHLGPARALDMLLRARLFTAEEAQAAGYLAEVCEVDELDATVDGVVQRLSQHAPLTMWASKEAARRLRLANLPDGEDLVRTVFSSDDFHNGVRSFLDKTPHQWTGQ